MKINLLLGNPGGYREDFDYNFDPFSSTGDKTLLCSPIKMGEYVDDGEAELIYAANVLSFFRACDIMELIEHWASKLAYDGELVIVDVDAVQVMKVFDRSELNFIELNSITYGPQKREWDSRKCALCLSEMAAALTALNLDIVEKRLDGVMFFIRCKRTNNVGKS